MADDCGPETAPLRMPSAELWGREVRFADGERVGRIDSIIRTYGGPVRALVRVPGLRRQFKLVLLDDAVVLDGDVVVLPIDAAAYAPESADGRQSEPLSAEGLA